MEDLKTTREVAKLLGEEIYTIQRLATDKKIVVSKFNTSYVWTKNNIKDAKKLLAKGGDA